MSKILVTGGCGYIGSHTIINLIDNGFEPISVDNNVRSRADILDLVTQITGKKIPHYAVDVCDMVALQDVFEQNQDITGIIHFAAYKSVPESMSNPLKYYRNNLNGLINILDCVKKYKIPNFIFSSSCSVYGNAKEQPVTELTPWNTAQCPYAATKQMGEQMAEDFAKANPQFNIILLRYFNPVGAHPSGLIGEIPQKGAYNVVPILIDCLLGKREPFAVTGNDYDTRDGTCIRDYIHIMDLANAHTLALRYLQNNKNKEACEVFNIGTGNGISILELIEAFDRATGQKLAYTIGSRRAGDVAAIYSDYTKAAKLLGWQPQYNVDDIMSSAWQWTQNNLALNQK